MDMRKIWYAIFLILTVAFIGSCGTSNESSTTTNQNDSSSPLRYISGYVVDDPVEGAVVTAYLPDGTEIGNATTDSNGYFEISISDEVYDKIFPSADSDADGPRGVITLIAEKDGRKLESVLPLDPTNWNKAYITNDIDAFIRYLRALGAEDEFKEVDFVQSLKDGRIDNTNSTYKDLILELREKVKDYFMNGGEEPSTDEIFEIAKRSLNKEVLTADSSKQHYLSISRVIAGRSFSLKGLDNFQVVDGGDCQAQKTSNGKIKVSNSFAGTCYITFKYQDSDGIYKYSVVKVEVTPVQEEVVASDTVERRSPKTIQGNGVEVEVPTFAIPTGNMTITVKKIETEGETEEGKPILKLEPDGTQFELPVTLKIHYSDFGIEDPDSVVWKIGNPNEGYEVADVVKVDKENQNVYLEINHFSEIVVSTLKGEDFWDLGKNYVVVIPRRNKIVSPSASDRDMIKLTSKIITNKLFNGHSVSTYNTEGTYGGGQCVQFVKYFAYPLLYKRVGIYKDPDLGIWSSTANSVFNGIKNNIINNRNLTYNQKIEKLRRYGVRLSATECQPGDILLMGYGSTGHVAIFRGLSSTNGGYYVSVINSNGYPSKFSFIPYPKDKDGHRERFGIGYIDGWKEENGEKIYIPKRLMQYAISYQPDKETIKALSLTTSRFVCLANPDENNDGQIDNNATDYLSFDGTVRNAYELFKSAYREVKWNYSKSSSSLYNTAGYTKYEAPWLYYVVSKEKDGLTIDRGTNTYTYDPDLLPVLPLIDDKNPRATSADTRFEIYVSEDIKNANCQIKLTEAGNEVNGKTLNVDNLTNAFIKYPISVDSNGNLLQTKFFRLQVTSDNTTFYNIPVSEITGDIKLEVSNCAESPSNKAVFFSPTVIDDQYIKYSDGALQNIKIGFVFLRNGKSELVDKLCSDDFDYTQCTSTSSTECTACIVDDKSSPVGGLSGYHLRLIDAGEEARWYFALSGPHVILVHIPKNDLPGIQYLDWNKITYTLHKASIYGESEVKDLILHIKPLPQKLSTNSLYGDSWYVLYYDNNGTAEYVFNLDGDEYLSVRKPDGFPYLPVDAIRIVDGYTLLKDIKVKGEVSLDREVQQILGSVSNNTVDNTAIELVEVGIQLEKCDNTLDTLQCKPVQEIPNGNMVLKFNKNNMNSTIPFIIKGLQPGVYKVIYKPRLLIPNPLISRSPSTNYQLQPKVIRFSIDNETTYVQLPPVKISFVDKKDIIIKVLDAINGQPISGANVELHFGDSEITDYNGTTDQNGEVTFQQLPFGIYKVSIQKDGYQSAHYEINIGSDTSTNFDLTLSPILPESEVRIVLTWGETPPDLDSHLVKIKDGQVQYHVYYSNMHPTSEADLDHDDTTSFGPETITIHNFDPNATYKYYVHDYSNKENHQDEQLASSQATVKVYWRDRTYTYYVPNGIGNAWKVFEIVNGTLIPCTENCLFGVDGPTDSLIGTRAIAPINTDTELFKNLPAK